MRSWENGTRCRDGVKVLWCHSHLVTFCDLFLLLFFFFFVFSFRNGKERRKVGGEDTWSTFLST